MTDSKDEVCVWIGVELPGRPCMGGTYTVYDYNKQPPVKVLDELKDVTTVDGIRKWMDANTETLAFVKQSPTACFFDLSTNPTYTHHPGDQSYVFFRDQQDCVVWFVEEKTGRVHIEDRHSKPRAYVAQSVGEFICRLALENSIWYKHNLTHDELTDAEKAYVSHFEFANQNPPCRPKRRKDNKKTKSN